MLNIIEHHSRLFSVDEFYPMAPWDGQPCLAHAVRSNGRPSAVPLPHTPIGCSPLKAGAHSPLAMGGQHSDKVRMWSKSKACEFKEKLF
jgi:hypothetical protein